MINPATSDKVITVSKKISTGIIPQHFNINKLGSIKVKRDNFLGSNATKNSINTSPPKDNDKMMGSGGEATVATGHSSNSIIPNKSGVRKPMNFIGIHT